MNLYEYETGGTYVGGICLSLFLGFLGLGIGYFFGKSKTVKGAFIGICINIIVSSIIALILIFGVFHGKVRL